MEASLLSGTPVLTTRLESDPPTPTKLVARPRLTRPLLPSPPPAGAQQQPFFLPDLVFTFLDPSFFSFLDFFLVFPSAGGASPAGNSVAGAAASTAAPMAMASALISSSVTGMPDMSLLNISGEMFMRAGAG